MTRKIQTLASLCQTLKKLRKNHHIVFTNGCFDLIHLGHIKLLEKAKKQGDILVVGLNSDASVRLLKGKERPILKEKERAYILAALEVVDFVVLFKEETPAKLIERLKPDVLVKGGDYVKEEIVGYDTLCRYGGKVVVVPLVKGQGTTSIINRILGSKDVRK